MLASKIPSVLGFVSIRQATSLVGLGAQVLDVDAAVGVGADLDDLVAGHRHRRGVGPVRGVGGEDLGALLAVVGVEGLGQQHARQLAVRARAGLQRDVRQPGDLGQRALEVPHQLQGALGVRGVLQRVQPGMPRQRRDALVQARVVLHRARAEGIEARVEVEVALGELDVMAHELGLGHLGQARRLGAPQARPGAGPSTIGTSISGQVNARRPGAPFSKIVVAASRCSGVSVAALMPPRPRSGARRPRRYPGRRPGGRCPPWSAAR